MVDIRDAKQDEVLAYYLHLNTLRATIVSGTGTGKSFIAMKLFKERKFDVIIILVNSTVLKDSNWKAEFSKFGLSDMYEKVVVMQTYQYMYKFDTSPIKLTENSIVIFDEVDFIAGTVELSKCLDLFKGIRVLGLTGFVTESKQLWFTTHLPIITEYTAHQAALDGLLNKTHFVFIKYDLSKNPKDILVEYVKEGEKHHFTQSENNAYEYKHKQFAKLIAQMAIVDKQYNIGEIDEVDAERKTKSLKYLSDRVARERGNILLNSVTTIVLVKNLVKYIRDNDKGKTIVFSKRTAQSIKLCGKANSYNGLLSKKKADKMFEDFRDGTLDLLGVCSKVNRGVNIPKLYNAILESFYGSDTDATQKFGRLLRLSPEETATVYILLPYFMFKHKDETYSCKPTQQVTWASSMLRSTVVESYEIWDYRAIKGKN